MSGEIHLDDVGTVLVLQLVDPNAVPVDISAASQLQMILKKNDGTTATKTAIFVNNGGDGRIQYATISGDLDQAGFWSMQAKVVLPSGTWYSQIMPFKVFPNL